MTAGALRLFSVYHKPFIIPNAAYVQPVQAGAALAAQKLSFRGDDGGDNISLLNPSFCELTVLYWIWKNADRSQFAYWGVVHYRRYFCRHRFPGQFTNKRIYNYPEDQEVLDKVVNDRLYQSMLKDLQDGCVILPKPMHGYKKRGKTKSMEQLYKEKHIAAHWDTMVEVLVEKYPDFKKSLHYFGESKMSFFNMMAASWTVWDAYLEWLFAILFDVEARIGKIEDPYQARVMGFLSERMINLFVYHQQYKTAYYPIAVFNQ